MTIETLPLLLHLNPLELQAIKRIAQERYFAVAGEIFREGDPGDGVYFVKSGQVEITSGTDARRVFTRLGPGEIFGEMAVIEQRPRSATALAAPGTETYFFPRNELLPLIEQSPGLAFGLLRHISARLRDFNQLHLREIIEAERLAAVGHFARGIVHDLKNPLSIIGLTAELLLAPQATPESRAQAQTRILRQVKRINDLISDILAFTQNRQNLRLQADDLSAFMKEFFRELEADFGGPHLQIKYANEPPATKLLFDRRGLGRVLHNLTKNAADAMNGNGTILFRFKVCVAEIQIEIEDTGPGIAPEIAGNLFQPFVTHGKSHGTGLGLAICKKIMEDHGGQISAHSEPGRGAIFRLTLPLAK